MEQRQDLVACIGSGILPYHTSQVGPTRVPLMPHPFLRFLRNMSWGLHRIRGYGSRNEKEKAGVGSLESLFREMVRCRQKLRCDDAVADLLLNRPAVRYACRVYSIAESKLNRLEHSTSSAILNAKDEKAWPLLIALGSFAAPRLSIFVSVVTRLRRTPSPVMHSTFVISSPKKPSTSCKMQPLHHHQRYAAKKKN